MASAAIGRGNIMVMASKMTVTDEDVAWKKIYDPSIQAWRTAKTSDLHPDGTFPSWHEWDRVCGPTETDAYRHSIGTCGCPCYKSIPHQPAEGRSRDPGLRMDQRDTELPLSKEARERLHKDAKCLLGLVETGVAKGQDSTLTAAAQEIEKTGAKVVYRDTDSIFVTLPASDISAKDNTALEEVD